MTGRFEIRTSALRICPVVPRVGANFACVQHILPCIRRSLVEGGHLAPPGMASYVLANGSMSSDHSGECHARSAHREWTTHSQGLASQRDIRRALIDAEPEMASDELRRPFSLLPTSTFEIQPLHLASLPGQIRCSTQIPVFLWFIEKNEPAGKCRAVSELELAVAA